MKKDTLIKMGDLDIDFLGVFVVLGTLGGLIFFAMLLLGSFDAASTLYNFEADSLTEKQVYDFLEDKHEAWFCNFDQTLDRHWCIAGKSNQLKILSIAERNVEIVEK